MFFAISTYSDTRKTGKSNSLSTLKFHLLSGTLVDLWFLLITDQYESVRKWLRSFFYHPPLTPLPPTHQHININTSTHQHINTSTHQHVTSIHHHINTSTHQTSTHQHFNTSTHQHINTSTPPHTHTHTKQKWLRVFSTQENRKIEYCVIANSKI